MSATRDRDELGRVVREAWVRWAAAQPAPKPSWLVPYDDLPEPDREADRQIAEAVLAWDAERPRDDNSAEVAWKIADRFRTALCAGGSTEDFNDLVFRVANALAYRHRWGERLRARLTTCCFCRRPFPDLEALKAHGADCEAHPLAEKAARLAKLLEDPDYALAEYRKGVGGLLQVQHWAVKLLADSLADTLGDAPNFMTIDVGTPEHGPITVTVQRKHGKSPAEVLAERNARIAELEAEVAALKGRASP